MIRGTTAKLILTASLTLVCYGQATTSDADFQQRARDDFQRDLERLGRAQGGSSFLEPNRKALKLIGDFATALTEYKAAVTARAEWEKPLKALEQLAQDLDGMTRVSNTPGFDKAQYAKLSRADLAAATSKFAESLNADLLGLQRLAENRLLLIQPDARKYLTELHGQILQLRFLISKTQSTKK